MPSALFFDGASLLFNIADLAMIQAIDGTGEYDGNYLIRFLLTVGPHGHREDFSMVYETKEIRDRVIMVLAQKKQEHLERVAQHAANNAIATSPKGIAHIATPGFLIQLIITLLLLVVLT